MSNFEKVRDFNLQFGVKSFETPQTKIFTEDEKLVELRMNLIREEMRELGKCSLKLH
jgi:predicted HAD superfamily Cof-like phosphohydrolase